MKFTHNGEFVTEGQKVVINYDIVNLMDRNGNVVDCDALIDKSGQLTYTAEKSGFLNITFKNGNIQVKVDAREVIVSKDLTRYYSDKISFKVSAYDFKGKVVDQEVTFKVNKKTYHAKTNKNGVATLKLKLKPGKYVIYSSFGDVKVKNKITVKNTLITKNLSKKVNKAAKFKVKLLNSKGKAFKKQTVKIKFKGKTYKIKTDKKGIVVFKVSKKLKVGKYTIKTTFKGLTNSNKITVKK
jgi:hypothetical protein